MAESSNGSNNSGSSSSSQNTIVFLQNNPIGTKLKETNYLIWRQQVWATVKGYGLEGYLTGSKEPPQMWITEKEGTTVERTINPDFTTWERQDQLLSAWLQSSLAEGIMVNIVGLTTSSSIWKALETNFASQSRAKVMQYKLQLQTLRKNSLSMSEYLSKVKACCDLLNSVGYNVSEGDQILHILNGLGSEYDPVVVIVSGKAESWTIMDVHSLLLSFENRLESTKLTASNTDGSQPSVHFMNQFVVQRGGHFGGFPSTRGRERWW